jgi:homoserine dehydrogenase
VVGIVNGSTNYILSRIEDGHSAEAALREAQAKGYAESDPSLDVDGWDAANKLAILLHHTYGLSQHPSKLVRQGIGRISAEDAAFAASRGLRIRLLARAEQGEAGIHALVWPHFVAPSSPLYHVREAMNGILLGSTFSEQQFLYGKGAGRFPTASAVLSDLSALRYGYQYALKKRANPAELAEDANVTLWIRSTKPELLQEIPLRKVYETYQRSDYSFTVAEVSMAELTSNEVFQDQTIASIVWPGEQAQSLNFLPQSAA